MPSLGADMEAGTLVEWLKQPGDALKRGDIIAVVETQKGAIEVEVYSEGVLETQLVQPGETAPVGAVLASITGPGEAPSIPATTPPPPAPAPLHISKSASPAPTVAPRTVDGEFRVSPAARRLAATRGVDPFTLRGTGPGGAVVSADVETAAIPEPRAAPFDPTAMREAIAAAMARSNREIPHYYLQTTIDMTRATAWLEAENAERPPVNRLLMAALLMKATALALRNVPELNGHFIDGALQHMDGVHVGMAIALRGGGLVAPAIHDTDQLSLDAVMAALRDLSTRVRKGRFRSSELSDPTITVTNLGDRGVETVYGVIYPPQVAIVGFGKATDRPWASAGVVTVCPVMTATLSADHRVSDGRRGAQFLDALNALLQDPETL